MVYSVVASYYSLLYQFLSFDLIKEIAEKEVARKGEFIEKLDFMSQQLEQLKIIDRLPTDIHEHESVVSRGLDIRSACMIYLGIHIRHDATPLGYMGKFHVTKKL